MILFLKLFLDSFPFLYLSLLKASRLGHWSRSWIVSPESDLVIEGFPRSANSFAVKAFKDNNKSISIATHVHMSSQVIRSSHLGIPCMVLLRHPHDAVPADLAFSIQLANKNPSHLNRFSINQSLIKYIAFYTRIFSVIDSIFIAHFPLVISDFGSVIASFNRFYDSNYNLFVHNAESVKRITSVSHHVGPTAERNAIKEVVCDRFNELSSKRLKVQAESIYQKILVRKQLISI